MKASSQKLQGGGASSQKLQGGGASSQKLQGGGASSQKLQGGGASSQKLQGGGAGSMADVRLFLSSRHHYILLAGFLGLVISDVTTAMMSALWNHAGKNMVTSSVAKSNTSRVATRCVMECHQIESCVSVAFDPESDICYLQPTYRPARQGDHGPLDVYTREKVAPPSLNGDVRCDADYMLSEDVTSQVRCQLDNGVWTTLMAATCKQFAWRNYTVLFEINLRTSGGDLVMHVSVRHTIKTTVLNYNQGEAWGQAVKLKDPSPPFPFAVGAPFHMVLTAHSLYDFSLQVNGAHYGDYKSGLPVTDVTKVVCPSHGDVSVESLIIGC
ncbi:hypothetical protein ACOMHN_059581 [Nucella lapillus]